jgi:hypothetical protein
VPEDVAALRERDIRPIDLVVVNLYPFQRLAMRRGVPRPSSSSTSTSAGPAMLRAAAKNFAHVAVVVSPERYGFVLDELGEGDGSLSLGTRRELAAEAFAHSASYEIAIANWFMEGDAFPDRLFAEFTREQALPYGENPHQRAAYYAERGARRHVLVDGAPARRPAALLQQHRRPVRRSRAAARVQPAGLRDHQAPEPVRRRRSPQRARGVPEGPGRRPGVGLRRGRDRQPARHAGAGRGAAEPVHRAAVRARLRGGRRRHPARPPEPALSSRTASGGARTPASAGCSA